MRKVWCGSLRILILESTSWGSPSAFSDVNTNAKVYATKSHRNIITNVSIYFVSHKSWGSSVPKVFQVLSFNTAGTSNITEDTVLFSRVNMASSHLWPRSWDGRKTRGLGRVFSFKENDFWKTCPSVSWVRPRTYLLTYLWESTWL